MKINGLPQKKAMGSVNGRKRDRSCENRGTKLNISKQSLEQMAQKNRPKNEAI